MSKDILFPVYHRANQIFGSSSTASWVDEILRRLGRLNPPLNRWYYAVQNNATSSSSLWSWLCSSSLWSWSCSWSLSLSSSSSSGADAGRELRHLDVLGCTRLCLGSKGRFFFWTFERIKQRRVGIQTNNNNNNNNNNNKKSYEYYTKAVCPPAANNWMIYMISSIQNMVLQWWCQTGNDLSVWCDRADGNEFPPNPRSWKQF